MSAAAQAPPPEWQPMACVLCACNCGVEVLIADGSIARVKGDKSHPASKGYACEKAQRLVYYQSDRRDWLAGTTWHKHVPARIEPPGFNTRTEPAPHERSAT